MATWQFVFLTYIALGALIILTTRARKEVFGTMSPAEIAQNPAWKVVAFYLITVPVALALWPIFLPSWFGKKETIWDALNAPKSQGGGGLKELFDAMDGLAEHGCDGDEIPGTVGRFGWDISNPVPTHTAFGSRSYLARLRTSGGGKVEHERIGSFGSPASELPVDGYELTDAKGDELGIIYLSPYHRRNSTKAPEGLQIVD